MDTIDRTEMISRFQNIQKDFIRTAIAIVIAHYQFGVDANVWISYVLSVLQVLDVNRINQKILGKLLIKILQEQLPISENLTQTYHDLE